jgi:hypothetical protein
MSIDLSEFRLKKEENPNYEFSKWFWNLPRPRHQRLLIDQVVFGGEKDEKVRKVVKFQVCVLK